MVIVEELGWGSGCVVTRPGNLFVLCNNLWWVVLEFELECVVPGEVKVARPGIPVYFGKKIEQRSSCSWLSLPAGG
jgi:hypothetical protein